MKLKIIALVYLISFGLPGWQIFSGTPEEKRERRNLIALHNSSSPQYDNNCTSCHGKRDNEKSLDPQIPRVHTSHIAKEIACTHCHKTVDLIEGSAANIRRQVNVEICIECHGKDWYKGGEKR